MQRDAIAALSARGQELDPTCEEAGGISSRERKVLDLTAAGLDVNEVAQRLFLTPGTVRALLQNATASIDA